jgi:hypothetical protein
MIELRKRNARRTGNCSWPLLRPCEVSASGEFHRTNGCSGWSRTSTVPGNNRMDYCYPTEQSKAVSVSRFRFRDVRVVGNTKPGTQNPERFWKLVSAGRFALPVTPPRTEHVAATLRAVAPAIGKAPGAWFLWRWAHVFLGTQRPSKIGGLEGIRTLNPPADNGALCLIELRVQMINGGKRWKCSTRLFQRIL